MKSPASRSLLPLLLAMLAAGCTSSPQSRADRNAAVFGKLSPQNQQLALAGQVRTGMSTEAVYVAWGEPTQVFQGKAGERRLLAWVYLRAAPARPSPDFGNYPADYLAARADFLGAYYRGARFYNEPGPYFSRFYPGAVFYPGPMPGSLASEQPILVKQAIFENGRLARFAVLQEPSAAQ